MKRTADVVIVGGGIQGISLAYHLARRGLTDVCLVEMNTLGSGSSGRSAAIIGLAFPTENCLPLTQLSLAAFLRFQEELDADPGYEPIGCLLIAEPQGSPALRRRHALLQGLGVESYLVNHDEISRLTPGLNLEDIEVGLYNPNEGNVDPHSIMMAYAWHARRLGAEFAEGVRATGIKIEGGGSTPLPSAAIGTGPGRSEADATSRVVGVHTTEGTIATPCVVNAAGFHARQVAAWAGMDLPITSFKRHIFFTEPAPIYSRLIPFTYDTEAAWYMRREGPGMLIGMGAVESAEEDPQVDWSFLDVIGEHTMHRAPALAEVGIQSGWAGLRLLTPDGDPILGAAPHLLGFWNDCGWGGHGIMHAPAAGLALAEWIVEGEATSVEVALFGAERFNNLGG